jgi:hypothetical protein
MASLPPLDLDCPDPPGCPVAATLPRLRTVTVRPGAALYRVYNVTWGYDEHNPGLGDTRFAPIADPSSGLRLPSMYLAATPVAALLETVFHDVQPDGGVIYERQLRGMLLAHVLPPEPMVLADLRDPELDRLGLSRPQVVAGPAEHYPCTRRLATAALTPRRPRGPIQGLIWHSRQAELAGQDQAEVMVLYGEPRYSSRRGTWMLFGPGARSLYEGPGRLLVEEIAESLGAFIELDN